MIGSWDIFCEIALRRMSLDLTDDKSTLVQVMPWCRQATSHYLNQCWPRSLSPYDVTRPQWVIEMFTLKKKSYDQRDNSVLKKAAAWLTNYVLKFFKHFGAKIWNLHTQHHIKRGSHLIHPNIIKTWSGSTSKCSVACLFTNWLPYHIMCI